MGTVLAVFKIMPEDMEHFEEIKERVKDSLPGEVSLQDIREEPIAFGLKAIIVGVTMEDKEGILDRVEEALRSIPHVENVTVERTTLI
ncbi:TPA: elongation factor 1-beta [Candidatus Micrarchaeota archaeon]|nr:elongation factor 1-beta [Candidatus Micrarchaeota archaeon]